MIRSRELPYETNHHRTSDNLFGGDDGLRRSMYRPRTQRRRGLLWAKHPLITAIPVLTFAVLPSLPEHVGT